MRKAHMQVGKADEVARCWSQVKSQGFNVFAKRCGLTAHQRRQSERERRQRRVSRPSIGVSTKFSLGTIWFQADIVSHLRARRGGSRRPRGRQRPPHRRLQVPPARL